MAGGRYRYGRGTTRGIEGAEREKTEETVTTVTAAGGLRQIEADPPERRKDNRVGGKYCAVCRGMEENADKSAEWGGEETEELASEEEADTVGRAGEAVRPLMATAG